MQVVVVVIDQGHAHARIGHVEVVVSISSNHDVFTGTDGPGGTVAGLIPNDGIGIDVQCFGCTGGHLPTRQVHVGCSAVEEFKPLAIRVGSSVEAVGVWDDFVDADVSRAGGGPSGGWAYVLVFLHYAGQW